MPSACSDGLFILSLQKTIFCTSFLQFCVPRGPFCFCLWPFSSGTGEVSSWLGCILSYSFPKRPHENHEMSGQWQTRPHKTASKKTWRSSQKTSSTKRPKRKATRGPCLPWRSDAQVRCLHESKDGRLAVCSLMTWKDKQNFIARALPSFYVLLIRFKVLPADFKVCHFLDGIPILALHELVQLIQDFPSRTI